MPLIAGGEARKAREMTGGQAGRRSDYMFSAPQASEVRVKLVKVSSAPILRGANVLHCPDRGGLGH